MADGRFGKLVKVQHGVHGWINLSVLPMVAIPELQSEPIGLYFVGNRRVERPSPGLHAPRDGTSFAATK
jgi:hypothetical protein